MSPLKSLALNELIVVGVCLYALHECPAAAFAQQGGQKVQAAAESGDYRGMVRCAICHDKKERANSVVPQGFCLLSEYGTFAEDDKHSSAFRLLANEIGRKMGEKLHIDPQKTEACLSCHSGHRAHEKYVAPPDLWTGVTCEACHGPSRQWDLPHSEAAWRKLSAVEKQATGMKDVRDPVERAKICFSCHIGNTEEGKVVTHEMYAAGHPPLPGIEIETFVSAMPAHWRRLTEKGNFQYRDEYLNASGRQSSVAASGHLPRTQAVLVGGVVALRESLRLLATQSQSAERPELAAYDCQSCHHELRSPAWRQQRPLPGRPGRPRPPEWPLALASVGVQLASAEATPGRNSLHDGIKRLNEVLDRQPFGNSQDLMSLVEGAQGADGLARWLDRQARALANSPVDEAVARKVLHQLYEAGSSGYHDFHSARQIAWAIRTIETELRALPYPTFASGDDATLAERVMRESEDARILSQWREKQFHAAENQVQRLFAPLNEALKLELPSGPNKSVVEFMPTSLSAISDYDPERFRELLKQAGQESGKMRMSQQRLTSPVRK